MADSPLLFVIPVDRLRRALQPFATRDRIQRWSGAPTTPIVLTLRNGDMEIASSDRSLRHALRKVETPGWAGRDRAVAIDTDALDRLMSVLPGTVAAPPNGPASVVRFVEDPDGWRAVTEVEGHFAAPLAGALVAMHTEPVETWPLLLAWAIRAQELGRDAVDDDERLTQTLAQFRPVLTHRDMDVFAPMLRSWVTGTAVLTSTALPETMERLYTGARARLEATSDLANEWDRARALEALSRAAGGVLPTSLRDRAVLSVIARQQHGEEIAAALLPSETRRASALEQDGIVTAACRTGTPWALATLHTLARSVEAEYRLELGYLANGQVREVDATIARRVASLPTPVLAAALLHLAPERAPEWLTHATADDDMTARALAAVWPSDAAPLSVDLIEPITRCLAHREQLRDSTDRVSALRRTAEAKRQEQRIRGRDDSPSALLQRDDGTSPLDVGAVPTYVLPVHAVDAQASLPLEEVMTGSAVSYPSHALAVAAADVGGTVITEPGTGRWVLPTPEMIIVSGTKDYDIRSTCESLLTWADAGVADGTWVAFSAAEVVAMLATAADHVTHTPKATATIRRSDDGQLLALVPNAVYLTFGLERSTQALAALTPALRDVMRAAEIPFGTVTDKRGTPIIPDDAMRYGLTRVVAARPHVDPDEVLGGHRAESDLTTLSVATGTGSSYVGLGRERRRDPDLTVLHRDLGAAAAAAPVLVDADAFASALFAVRLNDLDPDMIIGVAPEEPGGVAVRRGRFGIALPHPARTAMTPPIVSQPERAMWRALGMDDAPGLTLPDVAVATPLSIVG